MGRAAARDPADPADRPRGLILPFIAAVALWHGGGPVPRSDYKRAVRAVYSFSHRGGDFRAARVTGSDRRMLARMRGGRRFALTARVRRRWRFHRRIDRVTVYGKWSIDPGIVACESGGSWSAYNPSGAVGPYQLLGWGAPFPVRGARAMAAHHVIAARVWAGGAGRSNWVC